MSPAAVEQGPAERDIARWDYPCSGAAEDAPASPHGKPNASLADVIATECPTCHSGLEMYQVRAEKRLDRKTNVKILYFTQLLGLALGLSARRLGVHKNISDSLGFLKERGLA